SSRSRRSGARTGRCASTRPTCGSASRPSAARSQRAGPRSRRVGWFRAGRSSPDRDRGMSEKSAEPAAIGPFVVVRKLGEGAMGVVYEGYDAKLERKVALKLVRRQLLNNPAVRERMTREAQAMARLSNPNVVQV